MTRCNTALQDPPVAGAILRCLRMFAAAALLFATVSLDAFGRDGYVIRSSNLSVELSQEGKIVGMDIGGKNLHRAVLAETHLERCQLQSPVESAEENGGVRFVKKLLCPVRYRDDWRDVTVVEEFLPTPQSIRWQVNIETQGLPWTTPIVTTLRYPNPEGARFWTTWGDPAPSVWPDPANWNRVLLQDQPGGRFDAWKDPLVSTAFVDRKLWYGAPAYTYVHPCLPYEPVFPDVFAIPLATVTEPKDDIGLSLVLSPEDTTLDMTLEESAHGDVTFSRLYRRMVEGSNVRYSMDLVAHEADWRGGLRWMTERYPAYFNPPLDKAFDVAGLGAYSAWDGELDVPKLKKMGFKVNWRASYDLVYEGMFLPPIPDDQEWTRWGRGRTSVHKLDEYSRKMRENGFEVLNYFDTTEFGVEIVYPPLKVKNPDDPDLWKNANAFLYSKLADAMLYPPIRAKVEDTIYLPVAHTDPLFSFSSAVMDPGEPVWQDFLLQQAQKMFQKIPHSAGTAIDRGDWLRLYNFQRDDGVSWFDGPVRSFVTSWKSLMDRLGPMEHAAGQVIFVNDQVKRIDAERQVDGLFDEFGYMGTTLNGTAFLGISKPAIGWVRGEMNLKPDPDAFLQRYLHMGVYPMAPFPDNDHSIRPSAWADQQYLDYGPLFDAIHGRKWVLLPHAISVDKDAAKANLFRVPGGYVAPLTFGTADSDVTVSVRSIPEILSGKKLACEVIHPGDSHWSPCNFTATKTEIKISVQLHRGCAMVRMRAG